MLIQAGAEAVDEGHRADVQRCLVHTQSTRASEWPMTELSLAGQTSPMNNLPWPEITQ